MPDLAEHFKTHFYDPFEWVGRDKSPTKVYFSPNLDRLVTGTSLLFSQFICIVSNIFIGIILFTDWKTVDQPKEIKPGKKTNEGCCCKELKRDKQKKKKKPNLGK